MARIELYPDAPTLTGGEYVPISVLVSGEYVTRRVTTQAIANRATISQASGPSDLKDGVRSWLSPYSVSTDNTAGGNTQGINAAINAAGGGGGQSARVYLPQGRINVNGPILLRPGVELIGQGSADPTYGGTELYLVSGSNSNLLQDTYWNSHADYLDGAAASNIRLNGNAAGQTSSGSGVALYAMGEETRLRNLNIRNFGRYAIEINGPSLSGSIKRITSVACAWGTIWVSSTDGVFTFDNVRAELGGPLFTGVGGAQVSVVMNGCRQDNCGANPVFQLTSWNGIVSVNGGVWYAQAKSTNPIVNCSGTASSGLGGGIIFTSPSYQQNFLRWVTEANTDVGNTQRRNVELDHAVAASGGWMPTMAYPGHLRFNRIGWRMGENPDDRGVRFTPMNNAPFPTTWVDFTTGYNVKFLAWTTTLDRYTDTYTSGWT